MRHQDRIVCLAVALSIFLALNDWAQAASAQPQELLV